MSSGYFGKRDELYIDKLHWGLVTSCHILHKHGVLDAYGHVSVRNPDNEASFLMSMSMAPALLSSADEIIEYKIEDGEPVEKTEKKHFAERFIHSELYKKFPMVNAVVHSHCSDVLPYCITDVPLKASVHTSGFLGPGPVPVWDIASSYSSSDKQHDLLVKTGTLGHALAAAFKPAKSSTFIYSKMRSALPSQLGGNALPETSNDPDHPVVLMRGHGFTACADSLEAVVYKAIYTREAAKVLSASVALNTAWHESEQQESQVVGRVDADAGGKIKDGKLKVAGKGLKLLSDRETKDTFEFNCGTMMRPWPLWVREVEVDPLYRNNVEVKS